MPNDDDKRIVVEITDPTEKHCFRLVLNPAGSGRIEVMLHARSLVDLIHKCSTALCDWQADRTAYLLAALQRHNQGNQL